MTNKEAMEISGPMHTYIVEACIRTIEKMNGMDITPYKHVLCDALLECLYILPPKMKIVLPWARWSWKDIKILRNYVKEHRQKDIGKILINNKETKGERK